MTLIDYIFLLYWNCIHQIRYPWKACSFALRLMPYLLGLFYWVVCRTSKFGPISKRKSCKIDWILCHVLCFPFVSVFTRSHCARARRARNSFSHDSSGPPVRTHLHTANQSYMIWIWMTCVFGIRVRMRVDLLFYCSVLCSHSLRGPHVNKFRPICCICVARWRSLSTRARCMQQSIFRP